MSYWLNSFSPFLMYGYRFEIAFTFGFLIIYCKDCEEEEERKEGKYFSPKYRPMFKHDLRSIRVKSRYEISIEFTAFSNSAHRRIKYLWPAIVEYFCRGGLQARGSFSRCPIGIEYRNENQNCDSAMFSIKSQARIVRSDIPSCSSFNARKMISYIRARISENQSNIEILIHDNSTPFLLRDTRAFLPNLCSERVSQREKEGAIPRRHAITPFQTTMIAILPFTAHPSFSSTILSSASIKSTWSLNPPIEIGHHQQSGILAPPI